MDMDGVKKAQEDQLSALSDLVKMQNKAILDQRSILIKDMQNQLGALYPQPKTDPFIEVLARLDKIEEDIADLNLHLGLAPVKES